MRSQRFPLSSQIVQALFEHRFVIIELLQIGSQVLLLHSRLPPALLEVTLSLTQRLCTSNTAFSASCSVSSSALSDDKRTALRCLQTLQKFLVWPAGRARNESQAGIPAMPIWRVAVRSEGNAPENCSAAAAGLQTDDTVAEICKFRILWLYLEFQGRNAVLHAVHLNALTALNWSRRALRCFAASVSLRTSCRGICGLPAPGQHVRVPCGGSPEPLEGSRPAGA